MTKGMVFTTILAFFLNTIFNSAYLFLKFRIEYYWNTYKTIQIFISLSNKPASISNAILEGRAEFKTAINHITVDFGSFRLHHHLALTTPTHAQPHETAQPGAPPLC